MTKSLDVVYGAWASDRVGLSYGNPDGVYDDLHLRGSVGVDVPEEA